MKSASFLTPAVLTFPGAAARRDAWGRLLFITAGGAELATPAPLARGERLSVAFELGGERLTIVARVEASRADDDGQTVAELSWHDMVERRRLARVILEVLAKS